MKMFVVYCIVFFFFNDTATTEIYTLSLHDALPICARADGAGRSRGPGRRGRDAGVRLLPRRASRVQPPRDGRVTHRSRRSEEHTSELQSRQYLVCRLLLEKKKKKYM